MWLTAEEIFLNLTDNNKNPKPDPDNPRAIWCRTLLHIGAAEASRIKCEDPIRTAEGIAEFYEIQLMEEMGRTRIDKDGIKLYNTLY